MSRNGLPPAPQLVSVKRCTSGNPGSPAAKCTSERSMSAMVAIALMWSPEEVDEGRLNHLRRRGEGCLVRDLLHLHVGQRLGEIEILDVRESLLQRDGS